MNPIQSVWSRGVLYSLGIAINRILPPRLLRFRIFHVYQLQPSPPPSDPPVPLTLRRCHSEEDYVACRQICRIQAAETGRPAVDDHIEAWLATAGDQPVGGVWRAVNRYDERELGLRIALQPSQAWVFSAYVIKSHRRQGVYRHLLSGLIESDRLRHHYGAINPTNKLSAKAHTPLIRSTVGTCIAIRVFGCAMAWTRGRLCADRRLALVSSARPIAVRIEA